MVDTQRKTASKTACEGSSANRPSTQITKSVAEPPMARQALPPDWRFFIMPTTPSQTVEKLVTVESQEEFDLLSGEREQRVFLKLYVAARTSGLLAAISDRDWKTLCTLATYMDGNGYCFPSQAALAKALGCSRQTANERVQALAKFRFNGKPVLLILSQNKKKTTRGTWLCNGYRVLPIASLSIYDRKQQAVPSEAEQTPSQQEQTVSGNADTVALVEATVSGNADTANPDTNQNHTFLNENHFSSIREESSQKNEELDEPESRQTQPEQGRNQPVTPSASVVPPPRLNRSYLNAALAKNQPQTHGLASIASILPQPPQPPKRTYTEERQVLVDVIADLAREFGDEAKLTESVSRAYNLMQQAKIADISVFVSLMYEARSITKERYGTITRRMPYFFSVLADVCGLKKKDSG
jgi:hypothetical protein